MCIHCRYYHDRFRLESWLTKYFQEEDLEAKISKRAALKVKRLERTRRMEGKKDDF